ncbi:MAG: bifunctional (p)ppGpp synthetase/guanosine-3',5'-bis(diphosphate) 3'-pyrophosphohydrolase [Bacteroidales bacterium]|nr:bifunctional (p)ppGpp synthetase/guanosine-3',5'-bis(diphosphate) 3'-pyrophosphohydrolase [Bacteroidales bacterium]
MAEYDADIVQHARAIAFQALRDDLRSNGRPFIEHADGVARIAADEIGLGVECLAAVYLHEATRFHKDVDISRFPEEILKMVEGLNNIATIRPKDTRLEAENYKKLIVQYSTDPRVTVLKIADRLEVMRNLHIFPKASRDQKILETLMLYIPLAHQLGLYNIKSEMEDIYFRFAEPEQYRAITRKLKATEKDRTRLMNEFIKPLEKELSEAGIRYKLKIRTKTAYSIYRKMLKQDVPFEKVYDVFAIRFIIDCEADRKTEQDLCWKVYSYVTKEYEPDTKRLRDWVTNPKPNGYESLHITVKNAQGAYLEVQIRTKRMDDIAENGLASHWSYKGIKKDDTLTSWLGTVRYRLEHPFETKDEDLPVPPSKDIFVFTPTGELKMLPVGSSVLDFAFSIHTTLGCRCTGGRINGKVASIKEKLKTGDVVEILTSKNQKPNADWLNWVVSHKARSKIKLELDAEVRKKAAEGRELLERRLKNWKLTLPDALLHDIMHYLKYSSVISFMAAVGDGTIGVDEIKSYILNPGQLVYRTEREEEKKAEAYKEWKSDDEILVINAKGVKGLEYKMAPCCNPRYGDEVFGFVTRTDGIKIHKESCPNAATLKERFPYRVQRVVWQEKESK